MLVRGKTILCGTVQVGETAPVKSWVTPIGYSWESITDNPRTILDMYIRDIVEDYIRGDNMTIVREALIG